MTVTMAAGNVQVAVTGAVYVAPVGSPGPTGATTPLDPVWRSLGYLSSDGVTENQTNDSTDVVGWQESALVRRAVIKRQVTYDFTALETNIAVLDMFYGITAPVDGGGGPVLTDFYDADYTDMYGQYALSDDRYRDIYAAYYGTVTDGGDAYQSLYTSHYGEPRATMNRYLIKGGPLFMAALVIDIVDGPAVVRRYAPQVAVSPNGEVTFSPSQAIDYPLSCTCLPDPGIDGSVTVYYNRLLNR